MKIWFSGAMIALPSLLAMAGCDTGKTVYGEAVVLEEQGKLSEAAERYTRFAEGHRTRSLALPAHRAPLRFG